MTSPCWESASASASPSPWAAASKRSGPCATVAGSGSIVGGPQRPAFVLHLCEPGEDLLIALPIRGVRALQPLLEHRVLTGDGQLAEAVQQRCRQPRQVLLVPSGQAEIRDLHDQGAYRLPGDLEHLVEIASRAERAFDGVEQRSEERRVGRGGSGGGARRR